MKHIVFAVALLAVYPMGRWLRGQPRHQITALVILGLLPFLSPPDINFVSYEDYRGDSRGFEVTLLDLLVLALCVALPPAKRSSPFRLARYAYLVAAVISLIPAMSPLFGAFAIWKLLRMYVLLEVVTRACSDVRAPQALLRGMMLGVVAQFPMVLYQRYVLHVHQTPGWFWHQNAMAMSVNLVLPVALALLLSGRRGWLHVAAAATAPFTVVLSISRGALGALVLLTGVSFTVAMARGQQLRTVALVAVAMVLTAGVLLKAGDTIIARFESARRGEAEVATPQGEADTRAAFNKAAVLMLKDHPMGIGINQFSLVFVQGGYADRVAPGWSDSASFGARQHAYGAVGHNIYWLTLAELGLQGFVPFLVLVLQPMFEGFRYGWRARRSVRGDLLLGFGTGLLALNSQGLLEWTWRQTEVGYLFWMVAGIVAALSRQLRAAGTDSHRRPATHPGWPGVRPADPDEGAAGEFERAVLI